GHPRAPRLPRRPGGRPGHVPRRAARHRHYAAAPTATRPRVPAPLDAPHRPLCRLTANGPIYASTSVAHQGAAYLPTARAGKAMSAAGMADGVEDRCVRAREATT